MKNLFHCKYLSEDNMETLSHLDSRYKCEIAVSGSYHIDSNLIKKHHDKKMLKAELAEQLGKEIPEDKPLVFVLEMQNSLLGQTIFALNKLVDFCTVLFKPVESIWYELFHSKKREQSIQKLDTRVIVFNAGRAVQIPRFAADFILAGYHSGSFVSSIMLGLPCIPYYTRLVKSKIVMEHEDFHSYTDKIPESEHCVSHSGFDIIKYRFHHSHHFFDLLNIQALKRAILETEYITWYNEHLPEFQKILGYYPCVDAAQKTAEYILRFAHDGTLGKDCAAVVLKEQ